MSSIAEHAFAEVQAAHQRGVVDYTNLRMGLSDDLNSLTFKRAFNAHETSNEEYEDMCNEFVNEIESVLSKSLDSDIVFCTPEWHDIVNIRSRRGYHETSDVIYIVNLLTIEDALHKGILES